MNEEILAIVDSIEREKGIPREVLFEAIESALLSAAKKILGKDREDIAVKIDRETGTIKITGGGKKVKSDEFGRIAAQTAKQVIIQKIREAEREIIYDDYHQKIGSIVTGSVHRFERGNIIVDLGKTEGFMPRSQQCPNERYRQGDRIRAHVLEVTKTSRGPQIVLSRSSVEFVKKLFELEVPEITEGIVEVRSISREGGERTKIAVYSKDDKIDPVGACVGMRGNRVKDIVKELHGEKIDIVRWSDDIEEYLKAALSPAKISKFKIDREKKSIEVIAKADQLSMAIGKHGQNVRLASKLIGWELDIRLEEEVTEGSPEQSRGATEGSPEQSRGATEGSPEQSRGATEGSPELHNKGKRPRGTTEEAPEKPKSESAAFDGSRKKTPAIKKLDGVGKKAESTLAAAGFDTVEKIAVSSVGDLAKLDGIGKKTAEKIINSAKSTLQHTQDRPEQSRRTKAAEGGESAKE